MIKHHLFCILAFIAVVITGWGILFIQLKKDAINGDLPLTRMCQDAAAGKPILLLGDSVIDSYDRRRDRHNTSIADFLEKALDLSVIDASRGGLNLFGFNQLMQLLGNLSPQPYQVVIIELNPVILGYEEEIARKTLWHKRVSFQSHKNPSFQSLAAFAAIEEYKGASRPQAPLIKIKNEGWDLVPENIIRMGNMLSINKDIDGESLLNALSQIKEEAEKHAKHVVFYITPVDIQTYQAVIEEPYTDSIKKRYAMYLDSCAKLNLICLDFFNLVPNSSHFFDPHRVHLDEYGRKLLAEKLAHALQSMNLVARSG